MRHNWYRRLLISYFPIFFITISIIVILSFIIVGEISKNETQKADRISAEFIMENLDNAVKQIEASAIEEMAGNESYSLFLEDTQGNDSGLIYDLAKSMRELEGNNGLMESVYIYRSLDRMVLTRGGFTPLASFADKAFLEAALANPAHLGWSPARKHMTVGEKQSERVITMYKRLPVPFGSQGMLMINVSLYRMEQLINEMAGSPISFILIQDETGAPVYGASPASGADGSALGKVINTVHSDRLGWTLKSGIKAGQLFAWVSVISYVWLLIGILTVAAAIVYMVYISRKNYKPIQTMIGRIQSIQLRSEANLANGDEMALIDSALEDLINRSKDYEEEYHENLLLQRRQLFMDMVSGEPLEQTEQRFKKLRPFKEIEIRPDYCVITVEINQYDRFLDFYSVRDQNVMKFALINVFQEMVRNHRLSGWPQWIGGSRAAVLVAATADSPAGMDVSGKLQLAAEGCGQWVYDKLRISLTFGMGPVVSEGLKIADSYNAALEALEHKLSNGAGHIVISSDLPVYQLSNTFQYLQAVAEIVKDLRITNDHWRVRLGALFDLFGEGMLKDEEILALLETLVQMLSRELGEMSMELQRRISGAGGGVLRQELANAASLDEMKALLNTFLTDIYHQYVSLSENKSHKAMITEVRSYIEHNFATRICP